MADKNLVCKDCGKEFVFNESEQAFYKEKGLENEPQRCPACCRAKKQQRGGGYGGQGCRRSWYNPCCLLLNNSKPRSIEKETVY